MPFNAKHALISNLSSQTITVIKQPNKALRQKQEDHFAPNLWICSCFVAHVALSLQCAGVLFAFPQTGVVCELRTAALSYPCLNVSLRNGQSAVYRLGQS